jgi:cobalt/nickel transport system ATP-binding protein
MTSDSPLIELKETSYFYANSKTRALDNVNLRIYPGEKIALLGANGAGKSTLFKHLNGILKPSSGQVIVNGQKISRKNIKEVRQTVGIVFQDPNDQILAPTVEQVVAIAGILAMRPQVVVLDEPTAGLDPLTANKVISVIEKMNKDMGITVILSTHDVDIVPLFADRVYVIHHGRIEAEGTAREIFKKHEILEHAHLRMPRIAEVFELLLESGIEVDIKITPHDARDEILRLLGMQAGKCR